MSGAQQLQRWHISTQVCSFTVLTVLAVNAHTMELNHHMGLAHITMADRAACHVVPVPV